MGPPYDPAYIGLPGQMTTKTRASQNVFPSYSLRESTRAKRVLLRVSPRTGLEVVVPKRFDRSLLPEILRRHRDWIEGKLNEYVHESTPPPSIPARIVLTAVGQDWRVATTQSGPLRLTETGHRELSLQGTNGDVAHVRPLFRRWLARRASIELKPWLDQLSEGTGLSYTTLTVRGQKTRWGSCSSQKRINLNFKLLFLEPFLVRHVLIHELCHTAHLNHSPSFWALVEKFDPQAATLKRELRDAWRHMPDWLDA